MTKGKKRKTRSCAIEPAPLTETIVVDNIVSSEMDQEESPKQEEDIPPPPCPYLNPLVRVRFGLDSEEFQVHSAILCQSTKLQPQRDFFGDQTLSLVDTDPAVFELALSYLYRGSYEEYSSATNPLPRGDDAGALKLKRHATLYCFAVRYDLEPLVALTRNNIIQLDRLGYQTFLQVAIEVYERLPVDGTWFREYFKEETRNAKRENGNLAQEPWIIDIFQTRSGLLTVDLFVTLTEAPPVGDDTDTATAGDTQPVGISTRGAPASDPTECDLRDKHLTSLGSKGPWKSCPKCHRERDLMIRTGRAIASVILKDLWPSSGQDIIVTKPDAPGASSRMERNKKKLRKSLKKALCQIPIHRVMSGLSGEGVVVACPDQAEHLKKDQRGTWLWEKCERCRRDRELMIEKLCELGISDGFGWPASKGASVNEARATSPEQGSPEMEPQCPSPIIDAVTVEPVVRDPIAVENCSYAEDDGPTEPAAIWQSATAEYDEIPAEESIQLAERDMQEENDCCDWPEIEPIDAAKHVEEDHYPVEETADAPVAICTDDIDSKPAEVQAAPLKHRKATFSGHGRAPVNIAVMRGWAT